MDKMLNVYMCDDNIEYLNYFKKIVENNIIIEDYDMNIVLATDNPNNIISEVQKTTETGIYFIDIELSTNINGLQLATRIREYDSRGFIIFVTTHSEMTYLNFEYKIEAMDFIIKDMPNLKYRISNCLKTINNRYKKTVKKDIVKTFTIKIKDKIITEEYNNIFLFGVSATAHKIIMVAQNRQIEFCTSLKEIEQNLDDRFFR